MMGVSQTNKKCFTLTNSNFRSPATGAPISMTVLGNTFSLATACPSYMTAPFSFFFFCFFNELDAKKYYRLNSTCIISAFFWNTGCSRISGSLTRLDMVSLTSCMPFNWPCMMMLFKLTGCVTGSYPNRILCSKYFTYLRWLGIVTPFLFKKRNKKKKKEQKKNNNLKEIGYLLFDYKFLRLHRSS
jgi:hypothetical protein